MKLEQLTENPDGSADFSISDMTEEEVQSFVRLGIVKALEDAIEDAKKYDPALAPEPVVKQWTGMTEEELDALAYLHSGPVLWRAIEDTLKVKNT